MDISPARTADLAGVVNVEQRVFPEGPYPGFVLYQHHHLSPDLLLVAREDEEVIGYALGAVSTRTDAGWVLSLAVDPDHRGKGAARRLLTALVEHLQAMGCREVLLHVAPANTTARGLYDKLGFRVVEHQDDALGPGGDRLLMKLTQSS